MTKFMWCDECGSSDIYSMARDMKECAPIKDSRGILWATFKPIGIRRYGCKKHLPVGGRIFRKAI